MKAIKRVFKKIIDWAWSYIRTMPAAANYAINK